MILTVSFYALGILSVLRVITTLWQANSGCFEYRAQWIAKSLVETFTAVIMFYAATHLVL